VCVRNDALEAVLAATPEERREDLVFLQNGMLLPFLRSRGLEDASQALVYFAVAKLGDPPTDGVTSANPEGLTTATGKWANAFKARLAKAGLTCHVKHGDDFLKAMLEKHIWICSFMLVGAVHGGCAVGDVVRDHAEEYDALATELAAAGEADLGVTLDPGLLDRLKAYALAVAHFPTAVKEFPWRNGYFFRLSMLATLKDQSDRYLSSRGGSDPKSGGDPCPLHTSLLYKLNMPLDVPPLDDDS